VVDSWKALAALPDKTGDAPAVCGACRPFRKQLGAPFDAEELDPLKPFSSACRAELSQITRNL
jgi:hypothetical protein